MTELYVEVHVAFAQEVSLPDEFDLDSVGVMIDNLNAYEPTLFTKTCRRNGDTERRQYKGGGVKT